MLDSMDPFNNLSPAILREILIHLPDRQDVVSFNHASPALYRQQAMLQVFAEKCDSKRYLHDSSLVQDAMAVLLFPTSTPTIHPSGRIAAIDTHLQTWGAKQFPDPFLGADIPSMRALDSLYQKICLYVKDYLSKATSGYLPWAYRRLPAWSHPDFAQGSNQRLLRTSPDLCNADFDTDLLTLDEHRQIFRAFLRYELLCKIYGPVSRRELAADPEACDLTCLNSNRTSDAYDDHDGDDEPHHRPGSRFQHWDWAILSSYENTAPFLPDLQLLACVREYVLTLYGALIASEVHANLPRLLEGSTRYPHLEYAPEVGEDEFPDDGIAADWDDAGEQGWSQPLVSILACAGFDVLTGVLASGSSRFRRLVHDLMVDEYGPRPLTEDDEYGHQPLTEDAVDVFWHRSSRTCEDCCGELMRLYRQRAWALFDDDRLYPGGWGLPTADEFREACSDRGYCAGGDWDTTDAELTDGGKLVVHGAKFYPSLVAWLRPFWK